MRLTAGLMLALAGPLAAQQSWDSVRVVVSPVAAGVHLPTGGGTVGLSSRPDGVVVIDDQLAPLTEKLEAATVQVFHVPHAHTDGDALIPFRRANVIHMGDTFVSNGYPFIDLSSGGNVNGVIAAADTALAPADDSTRIIPGVRDRVPDARAAGRSQDGVKAHGTRRSGVPRPGGGAMRAGAGAIATLALLACRPAGAPLVVGEVELRGPPGSVTPHLAMAGEAPVLSWLEPTPRGHALRVRVRGPEGWRAVGTVVENDSLFVNWADFPSVVPLAGGEWLAHWLQKTAPSAYAYHVRMAVSRDSGRTWSAPFSPHGDRSPTEHGFVSIVPWGDGAAAVWLDGRKGAAAAEAAAAAGRPLDHSVAQPPPMTLRFTTVGPGGVPAPDIEVDGRVCDCCQTDLARARHGLVAVFRDRTEDETRDIAVSRFLDGAWTAPVPVADDGWVIAGCPVNGPQVAARGDSVVVAWFTAAGGEPGVYVAFSADGGATFGAPVRVQEGRPAGRVDVVWWGETALVSWLEETAETGSVRVRRVRPDGAAGPARTVAATSTARASGFPRMAVTGAGVTIAWTDPGDEGGVRVATVREDR